MFIPEPDIMLSCSMDSVSGVTNGVKGGHLPPGAALWGLQLEVGMLRTNYEMSNVSGC